MATPLISFEDAVTASNLDPRQTHAVFYADGAYANRAAVAKACPHAKLYGITVRGQTGTGIFAADSETGDLTVPQTIAWVETQIHLGVKLICVYANESRFLSEGLLSRLEALEKQHGVKVRKWLAHYTGNPTLEFPWVDAEQYADPGPVDRNVALADFFGDAAPVPPKPHGKLKATLELDLATMQWDLTPVGSATGVQWRDEKFAAVEVQVGTGGKIAGKWRKAPLPWNARPLGGS